MPMEHAIIMILGLILPLLLVESASIVAMKRN